MAKPSWTLLLTTALLVSGCTTGSLVDDDVADDDTSDDDTGDDDTGDDDSGDDPSDPIAWYPLDGDADDASGNGNHATVHGATPAPDRHGVEGGAYFFDGHDDGITTPVGADLSVTRLTLSVWVAIAGPGAYNPRIVGVGPQGSSHQHYALVQEGTEGPKGVFLMCSEGQHDGEDEYWADTQLPGDLSWHHVAATFTPDEVVLYVDGAAAGTHEPLRPLPQFSGANLQIGLSDESPNASGPPEASDAFNGIIDDVRIYDRALTAAEIAALAL